MRTAWMPATWSMLAGSIAVPLSACGVAVAGGVDSVGGAGMLLGCTVGVSLARGVAEATWAMAGGLGFAGEA